MAAKPLPSQEVLRQLLDYDPETGKLVRKPLPVSAFRACERLTAQKKANAWNGKWAGKEITAKSQDGYIVLRIHDELYRAHRVIWKLMTGEDPDMIDHGNGVRDDNRWANLCEVDRTGNQRNMKLSKSNTSGVCGVYRDERRKHWYARIGVAWGMVNLGCFSSLDEAVRARKAAEVKYGFHENHGKQRE